MKHSININLLLLATSLFTACSSDDTPDPIINPANDPDAIELGITAGVALTKSAINEGTDDTNLKSIAVYANGSGTSYDSDNNYALYTKNEGSWASGSDKIYLTNEVATIYGFHPAYQPDGTGYYMKDDGNAMTITGTGVDATINVTLFAGGNNDLKTQSTIPVSGSGILSAPGEVDYMWAIDGSATTNSSGENKQPTASNGKKSSGAPATDAHKVELKLKHALAMVSFKIYKDATYANTGTLTKIVLKNVSEDQVNDKVLVSFQTMTMKLADGTITTGGDKSAATYTRFIGEAGTTISAEEDKESAPKYSILVLPEGSGSAFDKNKVKVVFTIDGAEYDVKLAPTSDTSTKWEAGNNYLYTAKLTGKELSIQSVTVAAWNEQKVEGDLDVN